MTHITNITTKPNRNAPYKQPSHRAILIRFTTLTPFKIGLYSFLQRFIFSDLLSVERAHWRSLSVPDVASAPSTTPSLRPKMQVLVENASFQTELNPLHQTE